jgi:hypothetical protein
VAATPAIIRCLRKSFSVPGKQAPGAYEQVREPSQPTEQVDAVDAHEQVERGAVGVSRCRDALFQQVCPSGYLQGEKEDTRPMAAASLPR